MTLIFQDDIWNHQMKAANAKRGLPFCLACGLCLTILSNLFLLYFTHVTHDNTHFIKLTENLIPGGATVKSREKYVTLRQQMAVSREKHTKEKKEEVIVKKKSGKITKPTVILDASHQRLSSRVQGETLISKSIHQKTHVIQKEVETKSIENNKENRELAQSQKLLAEARAHELKQLDHISQDKFTIRINTWRRNEQLITSINHHSKCAGVAQIQVIWCDDVNKPPDEIIHHQSGKIVIEYHQINTLNERFRITTDTTPTIGIFSVDDDVVFPCEALDSGFFKWLMSPDRIVGYDARVHVIKDKSAQKWKYGYMSETNRMNKYSMILLRSAFIHRDYLDLYISNLPRKIFDTVSLEKNCEDIAMSFFVSSLTNNQPPLLADVWATKSRRKLEVSEKISGGKSHKKTRDSCVNDFAQILGLKGENPLIPHKIFHSRTYFEQGAPITYEGIQNSPDYVSVRQVALQKTLAHLLHNTQNH